MSKVGVSVVMILILTSCGTVQPLYDWKAYENVSYLYYKQQTPEAEAKLVKNFESMIAKPGGSTHKVPPGIYAEYGYYLLNHNQKEKGLKMMAVEIDLYPESKSFVERIIKQAKK
ncbi:MAG: DUF4810 domain-containing protein [Massilibacteroides sp.]|nr:DUF4810 domain-containing protein [Massilibacteroides sp.]